MVKEFTDLQGVVGGLYARAQGEPEPVWRAIYDHYKPLSMEDAIPLNRDGQIVALADKLDTLRGCFRVGLIRRVEGPVRAAARRARRGEDPGGRRAGTAAARLSGKMTISARSSERVQHYFREVRGFKYDEVNAVHGGRLGNLVDLEDPAGTCAQSARLAGFRAAGRQFQAHQEHSPAGRFTGAGTVDAALLEEGPERDLYEEFIA